MFIDNLVARTTIFKKDRGDTVVLNFSEDCRDGYDINIKLLVLDEK